MIDFHSHILPDVDDGSKNIEQSIEMLKLCSENKVKTVVLTPHCYSPDNDSIREFIHKRNEKYRLLKEAVAASEEKLPEIRLGCELHFSKFHAKCDYLKELAMEGTNYVMLEMPSGKWEPELYDSIYSMSLKGVRPIMAHIDRYFFTHEKEFHNLFSLDLTYQVNCDSFFTPGIKKHLPYFFERGAIHILGSDMHNLSSRSTNMAECKKIIQTKYGEEYYRFIKKNSELVLNNHNAEIFCFEKMPIFKKLKI